MAKKIKIVSEENINIIGVKVAFLKIKFMSS